MNPNNEIKQGINATKRKVGEKKESKKNPLTHALVAKRKKQKERKKKRKSSNWTQ